MNVTCLGKHPLNVTATTRNLEQRQRCVYLRLSALPLFGVYGKCDAMCHCCNLVNAATKELTSFRSLRQAGTERNFVYARFCSLDENEAFTIFIY